MTIDAVFNLLKYRANKANYNGFISSNDFNLLFPAAEVRYYNKLFGNQNQYQYGNPIPRIAYPQTLKISSSLSKFKSPPTVVPIDISGRYIKPGDFFYIDSLSYKPSGIPKPIKRIEEQDLANNLNSYYEPPTVDFPIYVEYDTYIQFYPIVLGAATLTYLKAPRLSKWAYTLNGSIDTLGTLSGGTGYTDGSYINISLIGGTGTSAKANITISGGNITVVTITNAGFTYKQGQSLTASNLDLGGIGAGFSVTIASIKNVREVYDAANSIDPLWADVDIDEIVYLCLQDIGVNMRDNELEQFSQIQSKTGGS